MPILSVSQLKKDYGRIKALQGVSFDVPSGTVFGILGPNGSGKTTLLGIIMDVLKATSGSFKWFGEDPVHGQRKSVGTLLETPNFYHYLSAVQNLKITAEIKGHGQDDIERVLEIVNLTQRKNSKFSTYSLGMKQRLAIAAALLGDPPVLVFDEPTNGLDPVGIAEIRELIKKLASQGKTIIMASHLLDEVEKVCSHVAILKKGELLASGNVDDIFRQNDLVELSSANNVVLSEMIRSFDGILTVKTENGVVELSVAEGKADLAAINRFCYEKGIVLSKLNLRKRSLESKFFELTN